MDVNFDFLKQGSFAEEADRADKISKLYQIADYRDVISNARLLLEAAVKQIFQLENLNQYYQLPAGEYHNLRNDTQYLRTEVDYPLSIMNLFDEVRRMGNEAIHDTKQEPTKAEAWHVICALHDILVFLTNSYDGQDLSYLRPDIAMEAQTDPQHYHLRQNKQPHFHLHDHQSKHKQVKQQPRRTKKVKYYTSSAVKTATKKEITAQTKPAKQSLWTKVKHFFK